MTTKFAVRRVALSLAPLAAALMTGWATSAGAVILNSGDTPLGGTTSAAQPQLAGTVVQDIDQALSWSVIGGTMNASVQSRVVLSDDGTYDFYWRVHDTSFQRSLDNPLFDVAPVSGAITAFRLGNFGMDIAGLNGDYRTDGVGDQGPTDAFDFGGGFVNFIFGDNGLAAGLGSNFMFLDTNAHHYAMNAEFDLASNGYTHNSDVFSTFGVASIPEPSSWALMIAGFGLAGAALRSRRKLSPA